ncbi:otoferlin [Monomorium pharaonis]|uniref:otoferlin n=1 Tax=Monomorium pharaonis TaxID=307658 RepID=UPI001746CC04|nr:otoferlin [Monomorium pharaonis]
MPFKKFKPKFSIYQVCITILEAKHLPQNANPLVVVKVGNRKKRTVVRERTDNPIYNEYFVFNLTCSLDDLLNTGITIAVYLRHFLRRLKFHGSISFEVATVWEQPDRQYYRKWAVLTDPKDLTAGPKGYVKCNITVNVKDEKVKAHPEAMDEDDIEGNLLLPIGGERLPFRQRARYVFVVYRADGLPDMSSLCRKTDFENVNPYVQISFAGMKGSTSEAWQTYSPKFNEAITFKEMFPVLCHRVRITIKHRIDSCRTCIVAVHILDTTKISNSGEYGFLPTYGPSFIHFYGSGSVEKNGCSGKCLTAMPLYRGRVLLSLKTEMDDPEASPGIGVETVPAFPIIEKSLWSTEEYLLVGVLYDVCLIDRSRFGSKLISFELSLGNAGNQQFPYSQCVENNDDSQSENELPVKRLIFESQSAPRTTGTVNGMYNYVPLGSRKPCLYVRSWWPNLEWRINNSNILQHISEFLETRLEKLEVLITTEKPIAFEAYNETIRALKVYCTRYLHVLDTDRCEDKGGTTKLDRHRASLCRTSVEDILKRIKINGELPNNNYMRIAMIHAYQYLRNLRNLCDDPQHSLPDVFIWMIAGSKRVAYSRLSAEQIIYSEEAIEMGGKCGRLVNLFPRNPDDEREPVEYSACKIEAFLWLGNAKYAAACWSAIPPGYEIDHGRNVDTFPKYIEYNQSSTFQLRAHIFQGRFDPGMDVSGLLDSFVRVVFRGYMASTQNVQTDKEECMALSVLHHWQDFPICGCALVPEHVERRPLFNIKRPGLEQGKLEIWVDMFRIGQLPPKAAINIVPPIPEEYEIRVIVWNTEDVPLTESQFLTGEKCSDIYVKGWIQHEDYQKTDIHYNSLTGEGNFNWRFVFRVTYSEGENVMIVRRKISVFAKNEIEEKLPCKLHLQIWDSDHFSSDDFLGELTLDLSRMPRGSSNSKNCTLKLLEPQLPTINLFKVTRIRAWWPLIRGINAGRYVQAGKVELEISILKTKDAENRPAGKGRDPPQNLPLPRRPDTSFSWFRNPWRACCFVVCRYYKWRILCCFTCTLFVLLVACGIYAFPGYFVKRLLGA